MTKLFLLSTALTGLLFLGSCTKDDVTIEDGSITFWTDQDVGCGPITISLGENVVGTLSNFSENGVAPDCGDIGYVTLELAPGSYSYNADDQCGTWSGLITIRDGECQTFLLDQ